MASCTNLAATFRHKVTIQTSSQTSDGQGGFTETWVDGVTVSASIEPLKGFERFQAMQMQSPNTHKIVTRYSSDITTACRLKFGERIFWVKEVINVEERNRFLEIRAIERS